MTDANVFSAPTPPHHPLTDKSVPTLDTVIRIRREISTPLAIPNATPPLVRGLSFVCGKLHIPNYPANRRPTTLNSSKKPAHEDRDQADGLNQ